MIATQFFASAKKNWLRILFCVVLFVGIALFVTWRLPQTCDAGSTLTVSRSNTIKQENVDYYLYDNYYSIQSGAFLADNIAGWLASPPIVANIYQKASVNLPETNYNALSKQFLVKKLSQNSNVISFSLNWGNQDEAIKLVKAANEYITEMVEELNTDQKDVSAHYTVNASEPVVIAVKKGYIINSLIAAMLALIISGLSLLYTSKE